MKEKNGEEIKKKGKRKIDGREKERREVRERIK